MECRWLEKNFLKCIREKAVRDRVPKMDCEVENVEPSHQILWFMTECPTRFGRFEDAKKLREVFLQEKLLEEE